MDEQKKNLILLDNLMGRMEYIDKQDQWKLSGTITKAEYNALRELLYEIKERDRREYAEEG